jgi:ABC-type multidrug transport system fused ATPase/permease subunit
MKKIFFLFIIIFSISYSIKIEKRKLEENNFLVEKNQISPEKDKVPPGQNKIPPGQEKKNNKTKEKELVSELSIFQMIIIGAFIILFFFLLVYFIIHNVNKRHQQNEKILYNRIHMLMKLSDSKNEKMKKSKIENNEDAPITALDNDSKEENNSINTNDDNEYDISNNNNNVNLSNKIIKPTKEDLKLYKPYDIKDENNNNSIKIELEDKNLN